MSTESQKAPLVNVPIYQPNDTFNQGSLNQTAKNIFPSVPAHPPKFVTSPNNGNSPQNSQNFNEPEKTPTSERELYEVDIEPNDSTLGDQRCDVCITLTWFKFKSAHFQRKMINSTGETLEEGYGNEDLAPIRSAYTPTRKEWRTFLNKTQTMCYIIIPSVIIITLLTTLSLSISCLSGVSLNPIFFLILLVSAVLLYLLILNKLVRSDLISHVYICSKTEKAPEHDNSSNTAFLPWTSYTDTLYNKFYS